MLTLTAEPLSPKEPVLIIRMAPATVLRYQTDNTAFTRPENVIFSSPSLAQAVAIREVIIGTSVPTSLIE